ncbi:tetratricopeptide repeat-containing sensor histidine kinase [Flavihumibacter petaseus]|uniref:histidine kinase n=1 Tax=Flavihumibacter petaseus NBRC 106054 TaxID=1220578 RepID=A0A0E9N5B3_9BACT|nr:ATP-binding protein [Flavihumibacter petaseus]GAO44998.1 putative two-component histidine kinase [Flavihumibacter petaseus NBRC 106054]
MKYVLIIILSLSGLARSWAQAVDTIYLKRLYDRTVDFSEDKLDSFLVNATYIEKQAESLHFAPGKILGLRLRGLHSDLSGNYDEAIRYQLAGLKLARDGGYAEYEISALSDLAIIYTEIKQPEKAKQVYLECLKLTEKRGEIASIISGYSNMGAIYNILNRTDSALHYLIVARSMSDKYKQTKALSFIYNNTGNVYFKRKEFEKALGYFQMNMSRHSDGATPADLWIDYLNIGDCFIELKQYDSAVYYTEGSLRLSMQLESKSKEADSYSLMAKLYERLGQYKKAYQFQKQWYQLDTALVNEESNRNIAEMQERYHSSERDKQNRLLMATVQQEKLRSRYLSYMMLAAVVIGILIGTFLLIYRRSNRKLKETNQVINRQKEKLLALNQEKNSLLSIVSHDLSTPFASIQMWSQLLERDLAANQLTALSNIKDSALSGERLIRHILEIEKKGTGKDQLELEEINLGAFLEHVCNSQRKIAQAKEISVEFQKDPGEHYLLTDQELLRRIMDNLLSNAIKFSAPSTTVLVSLSAFPDAFEIAVTDEGPGISEEDQSRLFTKYGTLSSRPTGGEYSTGLGLSIVKRLVSELNGSVSLTSVPGVGSTFTVRLAH